MFVLVCVTWHSVICRLVYAASYIKGVCGSGDKDKEEKKVNLCGEFLKLCSIRENYSRNNDTEKNPPPSPECEF